MSSFALSYGMEVIIPTEIGMPTFQTKIYEEANAEVVTKDLNMTDELREATSMSIASYNKVDKLVQQAGKTTYILRWRPGLEESL